MADVDFIVIGAGAVGLAIAFELSRRGSVMVLERHDRVGNETSSRNSEVIHAGLYYPPGSLRAKLCVAGKQLLYKFCDEQGVEVKRCGKLLVATSNDEVSQLKQIKNNAYQNGVEDLEMLNQIEAQEMEPALKCVAACLSPSTGVIDSHGYMQALEGCLSANGCEVILNTRVTDLEKRASEFVIHFESGADIGSLTCEQLVIAAGHGATELGTCFTFSNNYVVPKTWPAKGHYYQYQGKSPFTHLIYPMPDGAWLGTHLTLDTAGKAKFGPDIEWDSELNYEFDEDGGRRKQRFVEEIRRYWPALNAENLVADYTGIRPKIYRQGEPAADFAIHDESHHGINNLVALYGIESPGLTSSLAIAEKVNHMLS